MTNHNIEEMSELSTLEQAFYTGDYASVISTDVTALSEEDKQRGYLLLQRALIHSGKARDVSTGLSDASDPSLLITKAYADYVLGDSKAIGAAEELIANQSSNNTVKHLGGLILASEGRNDEALQLLQTHENSLDSFLLIVYIYLRQNQLSKAQHLVTQTKKWANDHVIFNLAEAWTSLKEGGDSAQKAFYIFEENNSLAPTASSNLGEAVAQLELRRFPEAEESLNRALELDANAQDVLATSLALSAIKSIDAEHRSKLDKYSTSHVVVDLKEKADLFDKVIAKYSQ